jgi:hypothetical protein
MEKFAEVPNNLDAWIETLFTCKPLKENDVKALCEQVILIPQCVLMHRRSTIVWSVPYKSLMSISRPIRILEMLTCVIS